MYCPACADEFRDGITHCPDCDVELVAERVSLRRPLAEPDLDPDEPVELFWTSDPQFLVDAAALLSDAEIPFRTEGAETLNEKARRQAAEEEPMAARLIVPAEYAGEARTMLDEADMDPAASGLPEPAPPRKKRRRRRGQERLKKIRSWQPKTFLGRIAWSVFRAFDYVFTLLLKILMGFISFLAGLAGLA